MMGFLILWASLSVIWAAYIIRAAVEQRGAVVIRSGAWAVAAYSAAVGLVGAVVVSVLL